MLGNCITLSTVYFDSIIEKNINNITQINIIMKNIQNSNILQNTKNKQSEHQTKSYHHNNQVQISLLDITYPYYNESMLAKSHFFGFQCLIFECGICFTVMYTVVNYINKGYILKGDILEDITNNFIWDIIVISLFVVFCFLEMGLSHLLLRILRNHKNRARVMYLYCFVWLSLSVFIAVYLINNIHFYFTDRIFIVVISWSLPVKTGSYCIDQLRLEQKVSEYIQTIGHKLQKLNRWKTIKLLVKFIISPKIVFKQFVMDHNPTYKIHHSYLVIKSLVATVCLLFNYILMSQIINPFLQPSVYDKMSFVELFFKLIPYAFYVNVCLYYLIMENILPAMAEITQLQNRHFYQDWWNAETISEFLDKWVILINSFSNAYLKKLSSRVKHSLHLTIIFLMLFCVFAHEINLMMIVYAIFNISIVHFLGSNTNIQNNYVVHFLTIAFTPFSVAAQIKYQIFS